MRNSTFFQGKINLILEILTLMAQVQLQRPPSRTALKQVEQYHQNEKGCPGGWKLSALLDPSLGSQSWNLISFLICFLHQQLPTEAGNAAPILEQKKPHQILQFHSIQCRAFRQIQGRLSHPLESEAGQGWR